MLVGPTGRWARELKNVTLTGAVTDDELAAIYTGAHALVSPSDDEGFGLPAIEALACGTPVAACDVPALREVLDGRVALSDVDDLDGLIATAEAISRPAPSPPAWSWKDAAEATWKVYQEALDAPMQWPGSERRRRTAWGEPWTEGAGVKGRPPPPTPALQQDRHRPVVDQRDRHVGAEHPTWRLELAEALVERLGHARRSRGA